MAPTATPRPTATPSPTPRPTPGPLGGGGLIVYSARVENNWDLYALPVGLAGEPPAEPVRLTAHPAEDRFPAISTDGRRLAFVSRRNGYWNLYVLAPDGTIAQVTDDAAYDGAPAWSPDGRWLAFDSLRSGNLDVWLLDLESDGPPVNLTADSASGECDPVWSPDGTQIAFTSWRYGDQDVFAVDLESGEMRQLTSAPSEEHVYGWGADGELLYLLATGEDQDAYRRADDRAADTPGRRLTRWRVVDAPVWSPDGTALAFLRRARYGARLMVEHPEQTGDLPLWLSDEIDVAGPLAWTGTDAGWRAARGEALVLYEERVAPDEGGLYDFVRLEDVSAPNARLSDRVDDSFVAMRARILEESGHDFLSELSDAWRAMDWYSEGSSYTSWHKAGRAFDVLLDYFSADRRRLLEVVLEPGGGEVFWRLYLRCAEQDGRQGMPLRVRPWDLTADARSNGRGGRYRRMPDGYYVDLTDLMAQYGWLRISSHDHPDFHWYDRLMAVEYWHFQKTEGLTWYDAMLELYPAERMYEVHRWEVQQELGMPPWLARAKGIPLPLEERLLLDRLEP
jgi:TolB protein